MNQLLSSPGSQSQRFLTAFECWRATRATMFPTPAESVLPEPTVADVGSRLFANSFRLKKYRHHTDSWKSYSML